FGFLQPPGSSTSTANQPVVMTVPMSDRHNTVVAETLEEFLSIGCEVGWFSLERIVYSPDEAIQYFASPDPESWSEGEDLLRVIRDSLSLRRIGLSSERLVQLETKYR